MTHFSLSSSRLGARAASFAHRGWEGRLLAGLALSACISGCLPAKSPADEPLTGEPSEVEILRADNAELSRRVHELRAEKAELKRRLALLELKVAPTAEQAEPGAEAAPPVATGAAASDAREDSGSPEGTPEKAVGVSVAGASALAAQRGALPRPEADLPVLISGSAEATDFDLGRAAFEAGSYQNADVTLSRFLTRNPRHPFADDALVLRGRARVARKQFDSAERDFRLVTDRYPEELVAPEAWLELVHLLQERGDDPGARQASRALVARYPDSAAASLVPSELLE